MAKYIIALLLLLPLAAARAQDHFVGNWHNATDNLVIEIYMQDKAYYAKIKSVENRQVPAEVVLIQMKRKSDSVLYGGTFQNYKLKTENEARIKLVDHDTFRLREFDGLFDNVTVWHRVHPAPAPALQTASFTESTWARMAPTR